MLDTQDQLARLRARIAAIEGRPSPPAPVRHPIPSAHEATDGFYSGQVVETDFGRHFETEQHFPGHRPYGAADIGALSELPHDLLGVLASEELPACPPERWAFLDTETTGLMGGSGTYAFLIGVGRICRDGFRVRQFFLREYAEEHSALTALAQYLGDFDALVTYNGRTYDQPLLETRYCMIRERHPFSRLPHLDLLYGSRRLWKLRLDSCKLTQLETQILGYHRDGDISGSLIPHIYFDYLRSGRSQALIPVFRHNALDIATLACLTALVPAIFHSEGAANPLLAWHPKHGTDLVGIARWLLAGGEPERALSVFQRAIDTGLPDHLLFRCLWDVALLEKKLGRPYAAVSIFTELSNCSNEYRARAFEELAKFYEHKEKNYVLALEFTCQALRLSHSSSLETRRQRLEMRLAAATDRPLFRKT